MAAPMGNIDKLTVVSADGAGALPKQVNDNVVQTMEMLKNTTGVDLSNLLERFAGKADDNRYVDFCLGDTGAMFGHSPPAVRAATVERREIGAADLAIVKRALSRGGPCVRCPGSRSSCAHRRPRPRSRRARRRPTRRR